MGEQNFAGYKQLGRLLVDQGKITEHQVNDALVFSRSVGIKLGEALVHLGHCSDDQILTALSEQFFLPVAEASRLKVDRSVLEFLPRKIAVENLVLPIHIEGNRVVCAAADPLEFFALEQIERKAGMRVSLVLVNRKDLLKKIEAVYGNKTTKEKGNDRFAIVDLYRDQFATVGIW